MALCRLLLEAPDLLLLDEPTNHLDAESVLWLEQFLHSYPGAVMAVTHDRYFLDDVAEWICEVDRGQLYPYEGNYSTYLEKKAARLETQNQQDARRAKKMKSELEWVRSSPKARQAKSRARLERYEQMETEALASKKLDFTEIQIPVGPRLGSKVLVADHLCKGFGDRVLIEDLSFTLPRNGIVGVIGPNGVGKTTLFKTIVGLEPVTGGSLEIGESVKLSYVDQMRAGIDPDRTLWEVVSDGNDFMMTPPLSIWASSRLSLALSLLPFCPMTCGTAADLTANAFARSGYTFAGWNTSADGTGTPYADAASVEDLTTIDGATVTLYAQWKANAVTTTTTTTVTTTVIPQTGDGTSLTAFVSVALLAMVTVTDALPDGLSYVSSTGGTPTVSGQSLTWSGLPSIPANGSYVITVTARVTKPNVDIFNTARTVEPDGASNASNTTYHHSRGLTLTIGKLVKGDMSTCASATAPNERTIVVARMVEENDAGGQ